MISSPQHFRIGDFATVGSGTTPARAKAARYFSSSGHEWVKTGDLTNSVIRFTDEKITPAAVAESNCRLYPSGTVLVAMYGGLRQIGRTGLLERPAAVNQAISAIQVDPTKAHPEYLLHFLNHAVDGWRQFAASSRKDPNITRQDVESFPVPLPPLAEQRKIAEILGAWDNAIDKTMELRRLADVRRAELVERVLVPSDGARRKLSELTRPIKTRNSAAAMGRESVMGVSNRLGLVPMREQTIAADISRYQVLPPRGFAYNPMRINVGSIAMSRLESHVLVSPDYVLFQCEERELRPEYLDHVLRTRWWLHHVNAGASGSVRTRTYYDDLAAISIAAPPIAKQDNVSRALDGLEKEIQLLQRKAELLRTQKRGLMQKLLTGQVRVNVAAEFEPGGQNDD
ncbi:restriction endonuclease subunit S [Pseudarthrobacter sp. AL07]|uniref:restriction endonuclease subunit S n=1 Tax=unclassified Pseudarthrobacter TaxID=2647000 RepID=UPI00249AAF3D|nr:MULTISPECIES: restriction endonuclease subunit S [unclassified Pseudarthrobacter]MDI3193995.1 restriction endonuclease subunit S [Pseudarthrobacter sp. AL20]MDI3208044.1 restriction endonuclease subunit S [Pseudarthrobacter sp. AL07]